MAFVHGEWYQAEAVECELIASPKKGTKGFKITLKHEEHGLIAGVWWLSASLVKWGDIGERIPQYEACQRRLIALGATIEALMGSNWDQEAARAIVGKKFSILAEINDYDDLSAAIITTPKAKGPALQKVSGASSPFTVRVAHDDQFGASDDDLPF